VSDVAELPGTSETGDALATEKLLPLVYEELRRPAAARMGRERPGQTLQATALVHEAWLQLGQSDRRAWRGREHFFSAAAEAMRRILVDNARRKLRARHGGQMERAEITLTDLPVVADNEKCVQVIWCFM
jgi:RNA polymerase sigma factor (TIGR02999 family)